MTWVVFALMTGAAVLAVLWPLARTRGAAGANATDRALYDAEIAGIERDVERGLASAEEASVARAEAARRLIAARPVDAAVASGSTFNRRLAAVIALLFIPGLALGLYRSLGAADYPDQPLQARLDAPPASLDISVALARIEKHLADQPDDARGWEIVAPVYLKMGRARDAARAWQRVLQLEGVTAERASAFGEALVYAEEGRITAQARSAFEAALKEDARDPRARFFMGLAAEQDGDKAAALDIWSRLLADSPPDASFAGVIRERIVALGGSPPSSAARGPGSAAGAAIAAMAPDQREAAIRGMVDALAERLRDNGADIEGWLRLIRAYAVLREPDKALGALAGARKALGGDAAAIGQLDSLSRELGLGG